MEENTQIEANFDLWLDGTIATIGTDTTVGEALIERLISQYAMLRTMHHKAAQAFGITLLQSLLLLPQY